MAVHGCVPLALLAFASFALVVTANTNTCTDAVKCDPATNYFDKVSIKHATTISNLNFANTHVDLTVTSADKKAYPYRLVRCGCPPGNVPSGTQVIHVPPRRLYVSDGPTIGIMTHSVQVLDRVTAVMNKGYVYSSSIRKRMRKDTPFAELAENKDVDVAFINFNQADDFVKASTGKPFFVNGESDEGTPFGRSEWIKIFAVMFDTVDAAQSEFDEIVETYEFSKRLANGAKRRPSVVLNYPYDFDGVFWAQPSQKQYITQIMRDANVDFLFMNDGGADTNVLPIDEAAQKFKWARFLINTGRFPPSRETSMKALFAPGVSDGEEKINSVLKSLASVHCANVWVNQKRFSGEGFETGNDYFEWGATRPDLLLRDMVHMFHPNVDVGAKPVFSFKLDDAPEAVKGGKCPYNDLLGKAPKGMAYVDTRMNVLGMDRFQIEDQLVEKIIPEVAKNPKIDSSAIDGFFDKPQADGSATLILRTMVKERDLKDVLGDRDAVAPAVTAALAGKGSVKWIAATSAKGVKIVTGSKSGLSKGAIGGIIAGVLAGMALLAAILYVVGSKRGRYAGEQEMHDRYWEEFQVRLAPQNGA